MQEPANASSNRHADLFCNTVNETATGKAECFDSKLVLICVKDFDTAYIAQHHQNLTNIERGFRVFKSVGFPKWVELDFPLARPY